jgi:type II secretory pathway component PulL
VQSENPERRLGEGAMAARKNEMKVVMTIPDMGLSKTEINRLKGKFKSQIVESLGGPQALARRRVVVVVVVVVVIASGMIAMRDKPRPRKRN